MSIASEITRIQGNVSDSYTAVSNKGGTLPATQNSDNLATAISTIPTGTTPTGTLPITSNGIYDVTNYANADVQVPTTAPAHYIEKTVDANGVMTNGTNVISFSGVTTIGGKYVLAYQYYQLGFPSNTTIDLTPVAYITGENVFTYAFYESTGITSVDMSTVVEISGTSACNYMFAYCTDLTSADLSSLTTISGYGGCAFMFAQCSALTAIDLSALTTISEYQACNSMFSGCISLTSVDLSSLTTITGTYALQSMFSGCTALTSANFNGLNVIDAQISRSNNRLFPNCEALASVTFGGLTASTFANAQNQLQYLFNTSTGSTAANGCTVHFPSNFDPSDPNHTFDASTLTGYPTFGGDANYIHLAFDLPATE